ncbi:unnamed protein product [Fusarium graminearum]|nr:unnamed protein product [Fusarium graminearum]
MSWFLLPSSFLLRKRRRKFLPLWPLAQPTPLLKPRDLEIDAMSINDMLATIQRDHEKIVQKMKKEREDAGRG